MRRKLFGALFAIVGAIPILLGVQAGAQAASPGQITWCESPVDVEISAACDVEQDTTSGECDAMVFVYAYRSYAYADFQNMNAGFDCTGWLERSTDGGKNWYLESGYHIVHSDNTGNAYTDDYWDGPGYLARACFHLNFSGAAHHCTKGLTH